MDTKNPGILHGNHCLSVHNFDKASMDITTSLHIDVIIIHILAKEDVTRFVEPLVIGIDNNINAKLAGDENVENAQNNMDTTTTFLELVDGTCGKETEKSFLVNCEDNVSDTHSGNGL